MKEFLSVDEARHQILTRVLEERATPVGAQRVLLNEAHGRVLARAVLAPEDVPRFDNSAMDGFAVRFEDLQTLPATLPVVETIAAGTVAKRALAPGEAMRIMTGAKLPEGADTVVQQELCDVDGERVTVNARPGDSAGTNVRHRGTYMTRGKPVLEAGAVLGAAEIGTLASFRHSTVEVARRPVVAIISTGDELVEIDREPGPGQIVNSNAYMLEALVTQAGGVPLVLPIAPDDPEAIRRTFESAIAAADLVVSSGGVSVGQFDHVKGVMDALSGGMSFWRIRLKPGKPLAFGVAKGPRAVPIVGLPGNPASSFVGFHLFVRPAIAVMQGVDPQACTLDVVRARLANAARGARGRTAYLGGRLRFEAGREPVFEPDADQSSGNVLLFVGVNALGIVPEGTAQIDAGAAIDVLLL